MNYFTSFNAFTLNDVKKEVNSFAKMVIINRYAVIEMVLGYRRHSKRKRDDKSFDKNWHPARLMSGWRRLRVWWAWRGS
jgi:hypothetical protein